jgi:hypothetical protein
MLRLCVLAEEIPLPQPIHSPLACAACPACRGGAAPTGYCRVAAAHPEYRDKIIATGPRESHRIIGAVRPCPGGTAGPDPKPFGGRPPGLTGPSWLWAAGGSVRQSASGATTFPTLIGKPPELSTALPPRGRASFYTTNGAITPWRDAFVEQSPLPPTFHPLQPGKGGESHHVGDHRDET